MHLVGGAHGPPSGRALRAYCVPLAAGGRRLPAAGKAGEQPGGRARPGAASGDAASQAEREKVRLRIISSIVPTAVYRWRN